MSDQEKLQQFLSTQHYMVLAVMLPGGLPWAVPVRLQQRQNNQFEWDSALEADHSRALATENKMAVTLFQSNSGAQIGVYMEGRGVLIKEFKPGYGRYCFTAEKVWLNDETYRKREVAL